MRDNGKLTMPGKPMIRSNIVGVLVALLFMMEVGRGSAAPLDFLISDLFWC